MSNIEKYIITILYITEAHPTEGGDYIDYFLPIDSHKTLGDRMSAASECLACIRFK